MAGSSQQDLMFGSRSCICLSAVSFFLLLAEFLWPYVCRRVKLLNIEILHGQSVSILETDSLMCPNASITSKQQRGLTTAVQY